jgi:hypothetical protein
MGEPAPPDPRHLLSPVAISLVIAGMLTALSLLARPFTFSTFIGLGAGNITYSGPLSCNMEDFDTTEPEKTESERQADLVDSLDGLLAEVLQRLARLEIQIGNLEARRTPQDNNMDDPEWF